MFNDSFSQDKNHQHLCLQRKSKQKKRRNFAIGKPMQGYTLSIYHQKMIISFNSTNRTDLSGKSLELYLNPRSVRYMASEISTNCIEFYSIQRLILKFIYREKSELSYSLYYGRLLLRTEEGFNWSRSSER